MIVHLLFTHEVRDYDRKEELHNVYSTREGALAAAKGLVDNWSVPSWVKADEVVIESRDKTSDGYAVLGRELGTRIALFVAYTTPMRVQP